jgi:hypothetical protein
MAITVHDIPEDDLNGLLQWFPSGEETRRAGFAYWLEKFGVSRNLFRKFG